MTNKLSAIKDLLAISGGRLHALKARSRARDTLLRHVAAALPSALAGTVTSAGVDDGVLTLGVASAAWASRLRYEAKAVGSHVTRTLGIEIRAVRVKIVPPGS